MDSFLLQKQIRDNCEDVRSFLSDLKSWEKDMKRKDEELLDKTTEKDETAAPIRSRVKRPKCTPNPSVKVKEAKRISSYDYSAWDKFNVEKACEDVDNDEKEKSDSECDKDEIVQTRDQAVYEKELGNKHVKAQRWLEAIQCYTRAVQCYPYDAVFYANRALCYLKTNNARSAETDCTTALQLDASYVKAYQRRALARVALGHLVDARQDFSSVLALEPCNLAAKNELAKLQKGRKEFNEFVGTKWKECKEKEENKESEAKVKRRAEKCSEPLIHPMVRGQGAGDEPCSDLTDTIVPIQKPPHLQSKKPLKIISIEEVDEESSLWFRQSENMETKKNETFQSKLCPAKTVRADAKDDESRPNGPPAGPVQVPHPPKTSMQFLVSWKLVRRSGEMKYSFLKQISGEELASVFQDSLESRELSDIISTLESEFLSRNEPIYSYLVGLSKVKRFSTLVMFMSKADKAGIQKLIDSCLRSEECSKEFAAELYKKYEIK